MRTIKSRKKQGTLARAMYSPHSHYGFFHILGFHEALQRLDILSFDQTVFLTKAKIMHKIYNNLAPTYLQVLELFQMRDVNLDNTASNLISVTHKNYLLPQPKCNLFKGSLSYSGVVVWNSIPIDIKNSKSLDIFIKKCTDWIKG